MDGYVILVGVLLILGAVFFVVVGVVYKKIREAVIDWPETEGKVEYLGYYVKVSHSESANDDKPSTVKTKIHKFKISYTVNGKVFEYAKESSRKRDFYNGSGTIRVKYKPSNPKEHHTFFNLETPWAKGILQFIIAAALTVGGIVVFCLAFLD